MGKQLTICLSIISFTLSSSCFTVSGSCCVSSIARSAWSNTRAILSCSDCLEAFLLASFSNSVRRRNIFLLYDEVGLGLFLSDLPQPSDVSWVHCSYEQWRCLHMFEHMKYYIVLFHYVVCSLLDTHHGLHNCFVWQAVSHCLSIWIMVWIKLPFESRNVGIIDNYTLYDLSSFPYRFFSGVDPSLDQSITRKIYESQLWSGRPQHSRYKGGKLAPT